MARLRQKTKIPDTESEQRKTAYEGEANMKSIMRAAVLMSIATGAQADELQGSAQIAVELNTVSQVDAGCQLTFLTSSAYTQGVEKVIFETVLINTDGAVTLLTLFDFGALPPKRPRVRQFVIPGQECAALGSVLINGVTTCSAPGLEPSACETGLSVSSRTDVELIG